MFEICFTRRYSMSHRLYSLKDSRCFVPHGHNEFVKVYLSRPENDALDGDTNMMAPFDTLKKTWHQWVDNHLDHSLHLSDKDPLIGFFRDNEPENLAHLLVTPGDPTTEALAACLFAKINAFLNDLGLGIVCRRLEIEETPTNTVIFHGDPDKALCTDSYPGPARPWWKRADMSINDLA
ncbi:6-pyruvoyl trahydropterin synthase family protein [Emcibacter nanhaiensis]|uniref:6-carboxy-5,6,7,8-tetrahydropterin synthase n=1 Tax=Emcibacter nanhaiensis TaxID=1505037 RepID=A0A501PGH7_9PROT|nr:6-carboxytetrahydropterin synthase [Emcibacter nanhaiensis]TPD59178.1 6-carboxytetrahydropterin synthase [Emcibacter nanhaiensis]